MPIFGFVECPAGAGPQTAAVGGADSSGGGAGGNGSTQSFSECVEKGAKFFSLQNGVQGATGGRLGTSWVSDALLGSSTAEMMDVVRDAYHGNFGSAAGTLVKDKAEEKAIDVGAGTLPNVSVTTAEVATTTVATSRGVATLTTITSTTATISLKGLAKAGLEGLATAKLSWDLAVTANSAMICAIPR